MPRMMMTIADAVPLIVKDWPMGEAQESERLLAKVRETCLALPETTERLSHGQPGFFIRDKRAFVTFLDNHHDDGRLALWCAAPEGMQASLVESDPEHYFVPPYVGHMGWIGVHLNRGLPWDAIAGAIETAYLTRAPVTVRKAFADRQAR